MYARTVDGTVHTFGVSGLLFRSNVLMYDHQTQSLWLQVKRRAVTGPRTGRELSVLPSTITTWKKWKNRHPDTRVLSFNTGHRRDYARDPYEDYYQSRRGLFRSFFTPGPGEEEKEMVAGVEIGTGARAVPLKLLRERKVLRDDSQRRNQIIWEYQPETDRIRVRWRDGEEIPHIVVYWFVWKGMYPGSSLYRGR